MVARERANSNMAVVCCVYWRVERQLVMRGLIRCLPATYLTLYLSHLLLFSLAIPTVLQIYLDSLDRDFIPGFFCLGNYESNGDLLPLTR